MVNNLHEVKRSGHYQKITITEKVFYIHRSPNFFIDKADMLSPVFLKTMNQTRIDSGCLYLWFRGFKQETVFNIQKIRKQTFRTGKNTEVAKQCVATPFMADSHI